DLTENNKEGTLRKDVVVEPLILRAAAGDWIRVELTNAVDPSLPAFNVPIDQGAGTPWDPTALNPLEPVPSYLPPEVSLHPALVSYDAGLANGQNVGFNRDQTVKPGQTKEFYWYAGILGFRSDGTVVPTPVEFGAVNLTPADPQTQHQRGLYGALIVEPEG